MSAIKAFLSCENGATAVEYGLALGALVLAGVAAFSGLGMAPTPSADIAPDVADQVNRHAPAARLPR